MSESLLPQFLFEGRELIQDAADALLSLEAAPDGAPIDRALLDRAFRAAHTLKGSAGLFDLAPMGALLHAAEDALGRLRDLPTEADPPFDALLNALGACESWLDAIERTGALPADAPTLAATLIAALPTPPAASPTLVSALTTPTPDAVAPPDWLGALLEANRAIVEREHRAGRALLAVRYRPAPDCFFLGDDPMAVLAAVPDPVSVRLHATPDQGDAVLSDPFRCVLWATLLTAAPADAVRHAFRTVPDQVEISPVPAPALEPEPDAQGGRLVRVDAARIDAVVDLSGEMLVARNALGALLDAFNRGEQGDRFGRDLAAAHAEIDRLTRSLRREAAGLRLAPLDPLFRRLPRLVREIAAQDGKSVELVLEGGGVELDRAAAAHLFEPLLHILRNAVAHGIEAPAARRAANKPERGRIAVRAETSGDRVVLTVRDDGAGIDPERIRAVAAEKRLVSPDRLAALDAVACLELVFLAGFSTAGAVTALSGRGVGMDAVRDAVGVAGGRVSLQSRVGVGTTIRIELPRAVSVSTVLLCEAAGERVAVPMGVVREISRFDPDALTAVGANAALVRRDAVLPLLRLSRLLGLPNGDALHGAVLVLENGPNRVGVQVDRVAGRADLLVRAPEGVLAGLPGMTGTAIGPDGRVLAVLDLWRLVSDAEPGA